MDKNPEPVALTLLVVDDDSQNLGMIKGNLEQKSLRILTTTDPEQSMAIFQEQHPDIVLVDLMMPKMNGIALLEKIVARNPTTEVILMTAHYTAESAVEA